MEYSVKATDLCRAMGITVTRCDGNGHFIKEEGPTDDFELTPILTRKEEELLQKRDELLEMDDEDFVREVGSMSSDDLENMLKFC